MRSRLLVLLPLLVFCARSAWGEESAHTHFAADLSAVRTEVNASNRRVQSALASRNWDAWSRAHDAYVTALQSSPPRIEAAITRFLFGVLNAGGRLDETALAAVDRAAEMAGHHTRLRVAVASWGTLARQGIPPAKRAAVMDVMVKMEVYRLDGRRPAPAVSAPQRRPGADANPMTGRTPGSARAQEMLGKWQYAYMKAQSVKQTILVHEADLASASEGSRIRDSVERRLEAERQMLAALEKAAEEWRTKYFEAGGR